MTSTFQSEDRDENVDLLALQLGNDDILVNIRKVDSTGFNESAGLLLDFPTHWISRNRTSFRPFYHSDRRNPIDCLFVINPFSEHVKVPIDIIREMDSFGNISEAEGRVDGRTGANVEEGFPFGWTHRLDHELGEDGKGEKGDTRAVFDRIPANIPLWTSSTFISHFSSIAKWVLTLSSNIKMKKELKLYQLKLDFQVSAFAFIRSYSSSYSNASFFSLLFILFADIPSSWPFSFPIAQFISLFLLFFETLSKMKPRGALKVSKETTHLLK